LSHDQSFFFPEKTRILIKSLFGLIGLSGILFLFNPTPLPYFPLISLIALLSLIPLAFLLSKKTIPVYFPLISLIALLSLISLQIILSQKINPQFRLAKALINIQSAQKEATQKKPNKLKIKNLVKNAISESQIAENLDPENSEIRLNRINILTQIQNLTEGSQNLIAQEFKTTVSLDPNNPEVYLELARYQFSIESYNQAENNLNYAINLKNDYAPAWYDLYQTELSLKEQSHTMGNSGSEKSYQEKAKEALKQTQHLVCEVNYSKADCEKMTILFKSP
jgi:tetratricopeptide (TPR) repeat protein